MLALLRLYESDETMTWREASMVAAVMMGRGEHLARKVRVWCRLHIADHEFLPVNLYGTWKDSIISDEDFSREINIHLQSLGKEFLCASDVMNYLNSPNVLARLGRGRPVSLRTSLRWMHAMGYWYGKTPTGMFVDGHERVDVKVYRHDVFLPLWAELEVHFERFSVTPSIIDGLPVYGPDLPPYILVTHDESTFYSNDQRKTRWVHKSETAKPRVKGEGSSLMVSDFCVPHAGWLKSEDG